MNLSKLIEEHSAILATELARHWDELGVADTPSYRETLERIEEGVSDDPRLPYCPEVACIRASLLEGGTKFDMKLIGWLVRKIWTEVHHEVFLDHIVTEYESDRLTRVSDESHRYWRQGVR